MALNLSLVKIRGILWVLMLAYVLSFSSCGDEEKFDITGEVAGNPTMNLYMRYYGDDKVMSGVTAVKNGKFEFFGSSKQPTIVEIMDNEYRILGRVYIANKQSVNVKLDRHNPYKMQASGTKINEDWSRAINPKADSLLTAKGPALNRMVEEYIAKNPQNFVSTLMFVTTYDSSVDPFRADSVLKSIDPEARIGRVLDGYAMVGGRYAEEEASQPIDSLLYRPLVRDTVRIFRPSDNALSLLVISQEKNDRKDSIVPMLKRVHEGGDVRILDIMLCSDTSTWRRTVRVDSAKWEQGWVPGTIFASGLDRLAIPHLPFFIITDSLGHQLYRTSSPSCAERALER
ncbi:MAG: DUF4369 domain-containing protein [Bacteroidales bacterium]|nr:DUF4369 domain-containing protein [Bacteroidales bacterium]